MGGPYAMGIFAFFYMWNLFGVVVLNGSMINWGVGSIFLGYMCILLYGKLIWCSSVGWIYDWLMGAPSTMGIFAFYYMWNAFGVVVLHGSMINWRRASAMDIFAFFYMGNLFGVVVLHGSIINWGVGSIFLGYMCILLYMKLIWCSCFPEVYAQLEEGVGSVCHDDLCIFALYYMCNCFGVVVLCGSIVN